MHCQVIVHAFVKFALKLYVSIEARSIVKFSCRKLHCKLDQFEEQSYDEDKHKPADHAHVFAQRNVLIADK